MRQLLLILSFIGAPLCAADEMLSIMPLPDSKQAIVGFVDQQGEAGFAQCQLEASQPVNCQMGKRFSIAKMAEVKARFEESFRAPESDPTKAGFELGVLAGLGLNTGQIITYYGIKAVVSQSVVLHYDRLFNTDVNSPPFVTFDSAGGSVTPARVLAALQFAASEQSR